MNLFNRAVVILEILLLIVLLIVSAVFPKEVLDTLLDTLKLARSAFDPGRLATYVFFLLADIVLVLLLVALLWLELRPVPKKAVAVRNVSGTKADMSTTSVEQSLQHRIGEIAEVLKVKPIVRGSRGGVKVAIDLETTPDIDVPAKAAEVAQAAREVVEGKMGLKVAGIKVHIRQAAYGKHKPSAAAPPVATGVPGEPTPISTPEPSTPAATTGSDNPLTQS
jgi:uncharacterized alkaline shock family protein YloU